MVLIFKGRCRGREQGEERNFSERFEQECTSRAVLNPRLTSNCMIGQRGDLAQDMYV